MSDLLTNTVNGRLSAFRPYQQAFSTPRLSEQGGIPHTDIPSTPFCRQQWTGLASSTDHPIYANACLGVDASSSLDSSGYQDRMSWTCLTTTTPSVVNQTSQEHPVDFSINRLLVQSEQEMSWPLIDDTPPLDLSVTGVLSSFDARNDHSPLDLSKIALPVSSEGNFPNAWKSIATVQPPTYKVEYCLNIDDSVGKSPAWSVVNDPPVFVFKVEPLLPSSSSHSTSCKSSSKPNLICSRCGKSNFRTKNSFNLHVATHSRPHPCSLCPKRFSRAWLLRLHLRSHTGEKPYQCLWCQREFADRSNWNKHQRRCGVGKRRSPVPQTTTGSIPGREEGSH